MLTLERTAVLLLLLGEGQEIIGGLHHTHIQKLVYLLQHAKGVPLGYQFKMHYYGPYAEELRNDLFSLAPLHLVDIKVEVYPQGYAGYLVSATDKAKADLDKPEFKKLIEPHREAVNKLLHLFKDKQARDVELIGATHYVCCLLGGVKGGGESRCVEAVRAFKPHFTEDDILQTLKLLQGEGLL